MLFPQISLICCVLPSPLSHFPDYTKLEETKKELKEKKLQKWYLKNKCISLSTDQVYYTVGKAHSDWMKKTLTTKV